MLRWRKNAQRYPFVIVPMTAIKDMIAVDMVGSSILFIVVKKAFMLDIVAFSASMVVPIVVKRILKKRRLKKPYAVVKQEMRRTQSPLTAPSPTGRSC